MANLGGLAIHINEILLKFSLYSNPNPTCIAGILLMTDTMTGILYKSIANNTNTLIEQSLTQTFAQNFEQNIKLITTVLFLVMM